MVAGGPVDWKVHVCLLILAMLRNICPETPHRLQLISSMLDHTLCMLLPTEDFMANWTLPEHITLPQHASHTHTHTQWKHTWSITTAGKISIIWGGGDRAPPWGVQKMASTPHPHPWWREKSCYKCGFQNCWSSYIFCTSICFLTISAFSVCSICSVLKSIALPTEAVTNDNY